MGDCWFLAGLAVISERRDLIARVLGGNGLSSDNVGCYEVNLFKDGRWERCAARASLFVDLFFVDYSNGGPPIVPVGQCLLPVYCRVF